jgi:release factor glutamine methyltransferase
MLSYSQAFYALKNKLQPTYDKREAAAIAHELMGYITGLDKTQRLIHKDTIFKEAQQEDYDKATEELIAGKPIQYIKHSAWFMGYEFYVDEHVLIPRPETEELVQWIIDDNNRTLPPPFGGGSEGLLLDIGTGSGCIPISLKLSLPHTDITSCDISEGAMGVATKNAARHSVNINFLQLDFLNTAQHNKLGHYDVIVSNPPYIPLSEKERLHKNVSEYEPGTALFVPDNDALVFYKAIATFGKGHLAPNGYIYCELDAAHAFETKEMFEAAGYKNVEIKKDMHGNWRMLKATIKPVISIG